jgi:hypothetical protein
MNSKMIFDFRKDLNIQNWKVVDDTVMGGRSDGTFQLSDEGHGLFSGYVTTENNGGFSSVRCELGRISVDGNKEVVIRLKGDGKNYQFRVKASPSDYYSYIKEFSTSGEWEEIIIPLNEMYPSFRGRKLDFPNFSSESISEITFLIGNKRKENFELLIDKIELQ